MAACGNAPPPECDICFDECESCIVRCNTTNCNKLICDDCYDRLPPDICPFCRKKDLYSKAYRMHVAQFHNNHKKQFEYVFISSYKYHEPMSSYNAMINYAKHNHTNFKLYVTSLLEQRWLLSSTFGVPYIYTNMMYDDLEKLAAQQ